MPAVHHETLTYASRAAAVPKTFPISENIPHPYRLSDSMTFGDGESYNTHIERVETQRPIKESALFSK